MITEINCSPTLVGRSDCLIVAAHTSGAVLNATKAFDTQHQNCLTQWIESKDIDTKIGGATLLPMSGSSVCQRVLVVGAGDVDKPLSLPELQKVINAAAQKLAKYTLSNISFQIGELKVAAFSEAELAQFTLKTWVENYYQPNRFKKSSEPLVFPSVVNWISSADQTTLENALKQGIALGQGINQARELGNLPGNVCTPSYLADEAIAFAAQHSAVECEILDQAAMAQQGMNAFLSVAKGSDQEGKLIVLHYRGGSADDAPIALVGKGITFDTGGISLKPGAAMDEMKYDMCGAASVLGTLTTVTELKLPINLVVVIAAAENMPSGRASKPGDIVTSMSGQTIEILNTDAEGRLVLCDALTYTQQFNPALIIDVATLTGACVVALGEHASGLYSNDDALAEALLTAGERAYDRAWRMPLWDEYQAQLDSNFADMANIGGPKAGSVTAASFLARFVKSCRWAHLDIAGTAWVSGAKKGATGRPVGLLTQFLLDRSGLS